MYEKWRANSVREGEIELKDSKIGGFLTRENCDSQAAEEAVLGPAESRSGCAH